MESLADRVLTVAETAKVMRVGQRTLYAAIARGEFPHVRIGSRIVVPGAMLERYLAGQDALAPLGPQLRAIGGDDESRGHAVTAPSQPRATRSR
jgi:excisionase family DNA binding protein